MMMRYLEIFKRIGLICGSLGLLIMILNHFQITYFKTAFIKGVGTGILIDSIVLLVLYMIGNRLKKREAL